MELREKIAFASGLMEGLSFDTDSKEGKMFDAILSIMEDLVDELEDMKEDHCDLEEFVEALDEDLDEVEDILGIDEDDDEDDDDDDDEDDDDDDEFVDIKCPKCGEVVCFDPKVIWESEEAVEVLCPNCDSVVFSSDECGEGCDCGCEDEESAEHTTDEA
jgi:ribosomal protein S27E